MKNCKYCKKTIKDETNLFCGHCGAPLKARAEKLFDNSQYKAIRMPDFSKFDLKNITEANTAHYMGEFQACYNANTPKEYYPFMCECKKSVSNTNTLECPHCHSDSMWEERTPLEALEKELLK